MPTGLTARIYEGKEVSFKDFALLCARQFGALMHMKDEPLDAPIIKREPNTFYLEELNKSKRKLEEFKANPPVKEFLVKEWAEKLERLKEEDIKRNKEYDELRMRYLKMLKQVEEWVPPTKEHTKLKQFMVEQLEHSIQFDCMIHNNADKFPTMEQYIEDGLSPRHLEKEVEYYQRRWDNEVKHCEEVNKWIEDLIKSL